MSCNGSGIPSWDYPFSPSLCSGRFTYGFMKVSYLSLLPVLLYTFPRSLFTCVFIVCDFKTVKVRWFHFCVCCTVVFEKKSARVPFGSFSSFTRVKEANFGSFFVSGSRRDRGRCPRVFGRRSPVTAVPGVIYRPVSSETCYRRSGSGRGCPVTRACHHRYDCWMFVSRPPGRRRVDYGVRCVGSCLPGDFRGFVVSYLWFYCFSPRGDGGTLTYGRPGSLLLYRSSRTPFLSPGQLHTDPQP